MRIATGGGNGGWTPPTVREADWVRAIRSNDRTRCAGWTASEAGSEALRRASYARLFRRRRASIGICEQPGRRRIIRACRELL